MTDHAPTLVFVDTETTSLRPDRRAWDIALIVRTPDGGESEYQWFVNGDDLDLGNADPFALRIGHFYERHPTYRTPHPQFDYLQTVDNRTGEVVGAYRRRTFEPFVNGPEAEVLAEVEQLTRGAHLVGCVPNWHYHLVDVENLAVGWLAARGFPPAPPWSSEALSEELGVTPPGPEDRHTALGDARWARDMYDAVMSTRLLAGPAAPAESAAAPA